MIKRRLFIHDPGDGLLKVVRASVRNAHTDVLVECPPECRVSLEKVGPQSPTLGQPARLPLLPGDYVLNLHLVVPANCAPCDSNGQLVVRTAWERLPLVTAHLACRVLPDIEAPPGAVLLSDRRRSAVVRIMSHTDRSLAVKKVVLVGDGPVAVGKPKESPDRDVRVEIQLDPRSESPAELREGNVVITFDDARTVDIPVVVLPASGGETN